MQYLHFLNRCCRLKRNVTRPFFFLIPFFCFCVLSGQLNAQTCETDKQEMALRTGNAHALAISLDEQVDLTMNEKPTVTYSRQQAEWVLHHFFSRIHPKEYQTRKHGQSETNHTRFVSGDLQSGDGLYKVTMFFIKRNTTYLLRELRFDKQP